MPIEAVIFDMDGVLINTEHYWLEARVEWASARGRTWTAADQVATMGVSTRDWARIMRERLDLPHLSEEQVIREIIELIDRRVRAHLPLLPSAVEAVQLAASRYPLALASGSPTPIIDHVMAMTGLDTVFRAILYGDDMVRGKPAPDIYLAAARALDVDPARCVGVEDSGNGIRALKAAGMRAIAVPSPGFTLADDVRRLADVELGSLAEFSLALVESLG